ncbi:hypothetical protein KR018_007408 [Drosophila ironensis]|nr:hypothetical protein KR018_007408 [Drosophila ironensis]
MSQKSATKTPKGSVPSKNKTKGKKLDELFSTSNPLTNAQRELKRKLKVRKNKAKKQAKSAATKQDKSAPKKQAKSAATKRDKTAGKKHDKTVAKQKQDKHKILFQGRELDDLVCELYDNKNPLTPAQKRLKKKLEKFLLEFLDEEECEEETSSSIEFFFEEESSDESDETDDGSDVYYS